MPDRVPYPSRQEPDQGSEVALVARVSAGDEAAFEALYREHAVALLDFAYACTGSKDEAEDVVQAVFVKVWIGRERWELRSSLRAYLLLATRNEFRDRVKHDRIVERRRTTVLRESARGMQPVMPACDATLEAAETAAAIKSAIDALAPQRRAVCLLRWAHGLSYGEIASKLDLAPKTVERHLALAFKELRRQVPHLPPLR